MDKKFSVRERKKAKLRLDLLDELLVKLKSTPFEQIKVKDLCNHINISEVTFFKYFKKKEELLQYFIIVWSYKRNLRLKKNNIVTGKESIYLLLNDIASEENAQWIMNTLTSYESRLQSAPEQIILSDCEKWYIEPNDYIEKHETVNETLLRGISEAIDNKQLSDKYTVMEYHILFGSIYYGTPVMSHISMQSLKQFYMTNLDIIFST